MSRFPAEAFVATVENFRRSHVPACPKGSEQEASLIESTLQQRCGDPLTRAFNNWRRTRRRNYKTSPSGIDLLPIRD